MKTPTNYYKVMYQINRTDKEIPKTIKELSIQINQSIRKEKLQKLFKYEINYN